MQDIFISYVEVMEAKVRRIYEDLTRAGFSVWEYKTAQQYGADFEVEFKRQLLESKIFCLLDCDATRSGLYAQIEVAYAIENKRQMEIFRVQEHITEKEMFDRHGFATYYPMWEGQYEEGMRAFCQRYGRQYIPLFTDPVDQDFIWEMEQIRMKEQEMLTADWQELVKYYKEFTVKVKDNFEASVARLKLIIEYSKEKDIPLLTPYLALATLFANAGCDADAIGIYENAARHFRDDPRIYAGLGAGHYYLGDYDESVHFYSICLDLINASTLENHLQQGVMIANNLLQSMLAKGDLEGYIERVDKIPRDKNSLYRIEVLRGKYFMYQKHYEQARAAFEDVLNWLVTNDEAPTIWDAAYYAVMILDLANVYGELGRAGEKARVLNQGVLLVECRWKLPADTDLKIRLAEIMRTLGETYIHVFGMDDTGLDWYERAVGVSNHIRFSADLALQCRNLHSPRLANALARCKARIDEFRNPKNKEKASPEDQYYFGLYYYLNGEYDKAGVNYRESRMSHWPAYERLVR